MTCDRENHLRRVKTLFLKRLDLKYRRGAKQHKEELWEKNDLLDEAIDEVTDLVVYLISERERRNEKDKSLDHRSRR